MNVHQSVVVVTAEHSAAQVAGAVRVRTIDLLLALSGMLYSLII